ncbi:MAG: c-type cytochrome [Bacteroidetes bacterium]|nr:c-type cytochrome [Bacteroidota bacterium]
MKNIFSIKNIAGIQNIISGKKGITFLSLMLPLFAFGQQAADVVATTPEPEKRYSAFIAWVMLGVAVLLMLVIYFLSRAVVLSANIKINRNAGGNVAKIIAFALLVYSPGLFAQEATSIAPTPVPEVPSTVSAWLIWSLGAILLLEMCIVLYFTSMIFSFLKPLDATVVAGEKKKSGWLSNFFYKKNSEEDIARLDLGHNYDGIKELDNDVPGWWKIGFYASMVVAVVYLYVYHIGNLMPLQQEELKIALSNAESKKAAILKDEKNSIDENTVTMLGAADIAAGKEMFIKPGACATCHGEDGSGTVNGNPGIGPNLADKYWLHKGGIKDIFYSIKFGWVEKGMKPWKDDYSPMQIAQIASFVKSLQGSNPAKPKEKQGELWEDPAEGVTTSNADSSVAK